jgi:segregation and condensation protein B
MTDKPFPPPADIPVEGAEELSRSYETLLGQEKWETDALGTISQSASEISEASETAEVMSPPPPKRIVEALLFVGGAPLTAAGAAEAIRGLTADQFAEIIASLNQDYRRQGRPYVIRTVAVTSPTPHHSPLAPHSDQGYVLELRPRYKPVWDRFYGTMREARLSPAAIDVLALVAYRQPATKQEIDSIRGTESGHLLRQLVRRRLIDIVHRTESLLEKKREVSYGTTERFLELFGLKSLEDLPQTQDLQKL